MKASFGFCLAILLAQGAWAETAEYSPNIGDDFPRTVYWGDTHLHSNLSLDASMLGNQQLAPAHAFRIARGDAVTAHNGMTVKLRRPLDFLVVSDHSEYLGVMRGLLTGDELLQRDPTAARWGRQLAVGDYSPMGEFAQSLSENNDLVDTPEYDRSIWNEVVENAETFNAPGRFTAFIGYEWSSQPGGNHLHRVVIFRDGRERAGKTMPFSSFDSNRPEDLWNFLSGYEDATGGQALAIPHNPNLSGGLTFAMVDSDGKPWSAELATQRARYEPLVEATQYKGDSEAHPYLSPEDEFADYETWDRANGSFAIPHEDDWFAGEYVRAGLKRGLEIEASAGANPFRFGLIGSTDAHTAIPAADEDDFWGKFSGKEPSPDRWQKTLVGRELPFQVHEWQMAASGYAAVWATENTRDAIFDAMLRRETYATTGPRMVVRLFGGYAFDAADAHAPDLARTGYAKGVPMGGVLGDAPEGVPPGFLIAALKDPEGANLDRVQVVKGWLDAEGEQQERVFDVALSGAPPEATTVDVENATWTNTIGAVQLTTVWQDPAFDPAERAFYYVRVIQIPTPRWTAYDAKAFDLELPPEVPLTTRDRAYTSPIWYSPAESEGTP